MAALLVLGACGDADESPGIAPRRGRFPVTIEHKFGSTGIPAAPERVVTVGFGEQDFVLAFGIEPVGVREWLGPYPFAERPWAPVERGGAEPKVVGAEELNFERIAALEPDLIVGLYSFMTKEIYSPLSQIAPTIAQSDKFPEGGVPWQEHTRVTGRALGLEGRAEELVAAIEARFAQAREAHPQFEGKTAAVDVPFEDHYILEPQDRRMTFFGSLGFEAPDETGEISDEQIGLLDEDLLVVFAKRQMVASDPLYRRLDAVAEGRVIYLPLEADLAAAIGVASPLSLPFALEQAVPRLAAAVDGDPATEVEPAP